VTTDTKVSVQTADLSFDFASYYFPLLKIGFPEILVKINFTAILFSNTKKTKNCFTIYLLPTMHF